MTVAKQGLGLLAWQFVTFAVAAAGGVASGNAGSFYEQLSRPMWAPPGWLFAPVWSVLYFLQGVAAWLVWRARPSRGVQGALALFVLQLVANGLWTWLFFAWRQGALAFGEIVLLWGLIAVTIVAFWRVRPLPAALLLPYLLWVSFAALLTFSIWRLNPGVLG